MYLIKALLLVSFFSTLLFSKGEVSKIYAHHENAADTTYTANGKKHKWGKGKNLVIDGFEYNGKRYDYVSDSPIVKIRRVNNDASSGEPCGLFAERKNGDSYKLEPAFPQSSGNCDMAKAMAGRVINVGALDLFRNVGYTAKNVERVDFISPNGLYAPSQSSKLSEAGHVVTEKSGNNYLQIAAILSIDANNNPTSFGPLVMIHKNNDDSSNIRYGMTTIYLPDNSSIYHQQLGFYVDNTSGDQGEPWWIQNSNEALGMAFVSLDDLGVNAGQKYYGFAYFGRDVTSAHTLTNINTFPKNTGGDTADPYGGVASYFVTEEIAKVSISDASIEEGDSGTKKLYFEVTLDKPAPNGGVTVQVQPHNESANEGEDYTRHTSSISFAQGESTKQIYYLINGDTDVEVDETFKVELHNPQNAVLAQSEAIGTIINDDTEDNSCHVPLFEDNFNNGLSDSWRVLKAEGGYTPAVTNNRLRLTNRTHDLSTASTIDYEFPTANNKFILEFDYYSYGGCSDNNNYVSGQAGKYGADGLSIVLFDSSVGREPKPGASGGSLGYANGYIEMHDGSHKQQAGFEKGWLGIGIDEFGCFKINDEGRRDIDGNSLSNNDEPNNEQPNTIAIRGGESTGYRLLESTNTLSSPVARQSVKDNGKLKDNANNSFKSGQYRLVVDSLNDANLYITLERKLDGGDWEVVIEKFDAMESKYHQGAKPEKFRIAFSSGTGGGCNNHEIDNVRVCSKGEEYTEEPPKISINNVEKYEGNSGRTNFIFTASLDKPVPQLSNDEETGFWYTVTDGSDGNESEYSGAYVVDSHLDDPQEQDVYGDARWIELPVGATEFNITVEVKGDTIIEPDERFFLDLYAPSNLEWDASCVTTDANGDTQCRAEGIILNDDESITPIAEYRFDECRWIGAKGEVRDNSVNGLHGRAQGEATTVTEGIIGRAGYFDGDQDYVEIANSEQLQLTENATFAFWINPENLSKGRQGILFKHYDHEYELILETDGSVNFYHGDGSYEVMSKPSTITVNQDEWSHVALTRNQSRKKLTWYINGIEVGTASYSETPTSSDRSLTIGIRDTNHNYGFQGKLDEIKLFDYSLTGDQVVNLYTNEIIGKNWDGTSRLPTDCSPYQISIPDIAQLEGNGSTLTPFVMHVTLDRPAPLGGITLGYETVDGTAHNEDYVSQDDSDDGKVDVCHNGETLNISVSALDAHLAQGDYEGACIEEEEDTSDYDGYDASNYYHVNYQRYWDSWFIFAISYWKYETYFSDQYSDYEDYYINYLGKTPKETTVEKSSGGLNKSSSTISKGSMGAQKSGTNIQQKTDTNDTSLTHANDYYKSQGTLTIPEGETEGNITLDVVGDDIPEPDESFSLNIVVDELDTSIVNIVNPSPGVIIVDDDEDNGSHLTPIGCQSSAWIVNDTFDLYEQNLTSRHNLAYSDVLAGYTNALGYNPADGFLWGYLNSDDQEQRLIKIGKESDGSYGSAILGPIQGVNGNPDLPAGTGANKASINIGDVDSHGRLHLLYRENADQGLSQETDHLYVVDLNSSSSTYKKVIDYQTVSDGSNGLAIVDWAFHPLNGKLYAVSFTNAGTAQLYEIDPNNGYGVSTHAISGLFPDADGYYEAFFDDEGFFYAYTPQQGRIYYLDLSDPDNPATEAHMFGFAPVGNGGDSARCNQAPMPNKEAELVAEYRFDDCEAWQETGGTVKDSSGNDFHGTTYNGVKLVEGAINSGAYFDGTSYVRVPNDPKLQLTDDMTISFWFKADDENYGKTAGDQTLIIKGWTAEFEVYLKYDYRNTGLLSTAYDYNFGNDAAKNQYNIDTLNWNQWYHFTLVRNSSDGEIDFYINGVFTDEDGYTTDVPASNDAIRIGAGYGGVGFKGTMDEVKIFDGMINSVEINDIYTNEANGKNYDGTPREEVVCEDPMEPFTCDETLYLSNRSQAGTGNSDSGKTWLHSINRANTPYDFDAIGTGYVSSNGGYNALGYNVQDNFMYALYSNTLVKIDKNAVVEELGVVSGLPAQQLYAGEFDRSGFFYASGMGGDDDRLYKINIDALKVEEIIPLTDPSGAAWKVRFWDMAIDASGSYFYTMLVGDGDGDSDYNNDKLAKINLSTGEITTIGESHSAMSSYISLVFSDRSGDLYMVSNEDGFYKADTSTGQLYPMSSTQDLTFYNDGTSCPDANITEPASITINNVTGSEDIAGGEFVFTITLNQPVTQAASFGVEVRDGTGAIAPIQAAVSPDDYLGSDQTITLLPGESSPIEIRVPIVNDDIMERHEEFYVNIVSPVNILVLDGRGVGTIINDDMIKLSVERIDSDSYGEATNAYEHKVKSNFHTQLTHTDFDYSVVSYQGAGSYTEFAMTEDTPIRIDLYDMNSSTENDKLMTTLYTVIPQGESRIKIDTGNDLEVAKATRRANFTLNVLLDQNGSIVTDTLFSNEAEYNTTKADHNATEMYGYSDSFAIRPWAYRLHITDSSKYANKIYATNQDKDTLTPLAAEYPYRVDAKAIKHDSDTVATNYRTYNVHELNATLEFVGANSCADRNDSDLVAQGIFMTIFGNGMSQSGQVRHHNSGEYRFVLEDINWTYVDQNDDPQLAGCQMNSSANTPSDSKYGCKFSSSVAKDADYNAMALSFEPYDFNITNTQIINRPNNAKAYIYMGDLNRSLDMGLELSADVIAEGMTGTRLTNFTSSCMAENVELDLNYLITTDRNATGSAPEYDGLFTQKGTRLDFKRVVTYNHNTLENGIPEFDDINLSAPIILPKGSFLDPNQGLSHVRILYNIDKHLNEPMNPVRVNFSDLNASSADAYSYAEGMGITPSTVPALAAKVIPNGDPLPDRFIPYAKIETGRFDANNTKTFYYAKVAPYEENYGDVVGTSLATPVYVALYCGNMPQVWCTDLIAGNGLNGSFSQEGWHIAHLHDSDTDGGIRDLNSSDSYTGTLPQTALLPNFNANRPGRIENITTFTNSATLPWTARITMDLDPWLLYHPIKTNGQPYWQVRFQDGTLGPVTGIGETGQMISTDVSETEAERIDW